MTSSEPDRFPEPKMDEIYGEDYRVGFSRGTYWGVACFIIAALFLAFLLYMGRPW